MSKLPQRILLILSVLGIASLSLAQSPALEIPRLITYQAQLVDKEGNVVKDGEHAVTAKLYTDEDGDELLWGDTYLVKTSRGVVDLALGSGDIPLPAATELSRPLWLGVSLDGGEEMRPLLAFSAVPYALNVADGSITAAKLATDYVASFSINGQQITGRGGKIDLYAGNGVKLSYDSVSNQLLIMGTTRGGGKVEPEVLAMSLFAKEDLLVNGNATLNVDSGQTDIRGNAILGGSSSKTINFKAKSISDLDMNVNSLHNVDTLTLGKGGTKQGVIEMTTQHLGHKVTIRADSQAANRTYTIPDVGEDSKFLMTSGLQSLDTVIFTNILIPTNDNAYALGDPDLRYRDIYMGPGSLHLIASVDEGVTEEKDYAQQIDVNNGAGNGDLVFRESGEDLLRVTATGDVTVTGSTATAGIETSENITPTEDNYVQIGSEEARIADIYLGPSSLHLIASIDDGVATDMDYAQQVDTEVGDGNGDLVIRESGEDLMRIAPTGDVSVTGKTSSAGVETSENITPTEDNYVQIGSEEARIADIYLGPSSLHLIASIDDGVAADMDYAQQVDTEVGDGNGDLVIRESGDDLMRISPTGDVSVTGTTTTDGVETSGNIVPTTDNSITLGEPTSRYMDVYVGPGSIHVSGSSAELGGAAARDWVLDLLQSGDDAGNFQILEGGNLALSLTPAGDAAITGKVTSSPTLLADAPATLATKGYVDGVGNSQWGIAGNTGLTTDNFIGTTDANPLIVKTNGIERMRVLSSGFVGINETDPVAALDVDGGFHLTGPATVVGTLNFDGSLYGIGNGSVTGSFAAADLMAGASPSTAGDVFIYDGNSNWANVKSADLTGDRTFSLPNASGTLALTSDVASLAWARTGNAGTSGTNDFIGTTDGQNLTLKANNAPRIVLDVADNTNYFEGQMSVFNTQMQVQGGIETWNGLSVHGDTWLQEGNIFLGGNTTVAANLTVTGTTNSISGLTNTLNGTLNINGATNIAGTTTVGGTVVINGETDINGDLEATTLTVPTITTNTIGGFTLAGNIVADGNPITGIGNLTATDVEISGLLLVNDIGGHTMSGNINMDEFDIVNPFSITGVNNFATHDATISGLLEPTLMGGFTMVGGINMNNQDINSADQIIVTQVQANEVVVSNLTSSTSIVAQDELRIQRGSGVYSSFEGNTAQSSNITYTLPATQGNPGTVLQNNGSGVLAWGTMVHREVVTYDVPSIPANTEYAFTLSVNGAPLGAAAFVSPQLGLPGNVLIEYVRVSGVDTVEVRLLNRSAAAVDISSMDWYIGIIR